MKKNPHHRRSHPIIRPLTTLTTGLALLATSSALLADPAVQAEAHPRSSDGTLYLGNATLPIVTSPPRATPESTTPAVAKVPANFGAPSEAQLKVDAEFQLAEFLYRSSNPDAIKHFENAASAGHGFANYRLGSIHQQGHLPGVEADMDRALGYYRKAAEKKDAAALSTLARHYMETDPARAARYLRICANEGIGCPGTIGAAAHTLGLMYAEGKGIPKNIDQAIQHLENGWGQGLHLGKLYEQKAAREKDPDLQAEFYASAVANYEKEGSAENKAEALYRLAMLHKDGNGVPQDDAKAEELISDAAARGHDLSKFLLEPASAATDSEVPSEERLTVLQRAAGEGIANAQFELGRLLIDGRGVKADPTEAGKLLHAASRQGHADASYALAQLHLEGVGVRRDGYRAFWLIEQAAENGHTQAQLELAQMYESGRNTRRNTSKAFEWYLKAAQSGLVQAQYAVGSAYAKGRGTDFAPAQAATFLRKAADQNDLDAQMDILKIYFADTSGQTADAPLAELKNNISGIPKENILQYAKTAASAGQPSAHYYLGMCYARGIGTSEDADQAAQAFASALVPKPPSETTE